MTTSVMSLLSAQALRKHYASGAWTDETIYALVRRHAHERPDACALRDRQRRFTYRELIAAADALAGDFEKAGLRAGNRVVIWLPNRVETVVALLACSRSGLICCPSPHRNHTVMEITSLLERTRCAAFLYQRGYGADATQHDVAERLSRIDSLRCAYCLEPVQEGVDRERPLRSLFGDRDPCMIDEAWSTDPNRVMFLAFTSGSTGSPKGVMHSDNTQLSTLRALVADWQLGTDTVVYSMSPLCHNLGVGALLTSFISGGEFVVHDLSRGESVLDRLIDFGANYLVGVPTHALDLLSEARQRGLSKFTGLKGFRVSGAASGPELLGSLLEFGIPVQSGYGMTETCSHQYTLPFDNPTRITESCGRACHGYEVRIWSPDDPDTEMPVGRIGQVGGRGASLMLGYFDDQIATESSFNAAGWFLTGDLGFLDADGYLHLTGRMKELIIRGGHNINPAGIEKLVLQFDEIAHAAVVGMPDPRLGERICLAVQFHRGKRVSNERICQHLRQAGLSRYEMPEFLAEMDDVPLMPNGKVRKREIEQAVREGAVPVQVIAGEGAPAPAGAASPPAS